MADNTVNLPGKSLGMRYATQHVGGAFDAKSPPKPKTIEKALEDALWTKYTGSLFLVGLDTTPYSPGVPNFVAVRPEPSGKGMPGIYQPKPFTPTPPKPFGPIVDFPIVIFWDTDSDDWDGDDVDRKGQTFWDS